MAPELWTRRQLRDPPFECHSEVIEYKQTPTTKKKKKKEIEQSK